MFLSAYPSNFAQNSTSKMSKKSFVLHDESVNTYGFRMLTSGANLEEFKKNPVMLLNHGDWDLPIGRWENIRIEGTQILADPVFDEEDVRAKEVKRKVDHDFIRMASVGAWPPEEKSDAYSLMFQGQTLPTVTKWTVREASIVTIGANHNALAFYDRNSEKVIDLNDKTNLIRLMDSNNLKTKIKMSVLTGILNLQDNSGEAEIAAAVQGIIRNADRLKTENETLTAAIDKINKEKKAEQKTEAVTLTDNAIRTGLYDAKGRETLLKLFDVDFEGTKTMLAAIPRRAGVVSQLNIGGKASVELGGWTEKSWDELDKAGKLVALKDSAPDLYKSKFKERFGIEPIL